MIPVVPLAMALTQAWAASDGVAFPEDTSSHRITAGVELFGLFLDGQQLELGYERGRWRLAASRGSLDSLWNGSDTVSVRNSWVELTPTAYVWQPRRRRGGVHLGPNASWFYDVRAVQDASGQELRKSFGRVGVRAGWFLYPLANHPLFVEPTVNLGVAIGDETLTFDDGDQLLSNPVQITGLVINVGMAFDVKRKKNDA